MRHRRHERGRTLPLSSHQRNHRPPPRLRGLLLMPQWLLAGRSNHDLSKNRTLYGRHRTLLVEVEVHHPLPHHRSCHRLLLLRRFNLFELMTGCV